MELLNNFLRDMYSLILYMWLYCKLWLNYKMKYNIYFILIFNCHYYKLSVHQKLTEGVNWLGAILVKYLVALKNDPKMIW